MHNKKEIWRDGVKYNCSEDVTSADFVSDSSEECSILAGINGKDWAKENLHKWTEWEERWAKEAEEDKKIRKKRTLCLWYGVRAPDEYDRPGPSLDDEFYKKIQKFIKSDSINKAVYNFEWKYDDDGNRYGIHSHMLLFGDITKIKFHIKRQQNKMFNLNPKQLQEIKDEEVIGDKLNYMDGKIFCDKDEVKQEEKNLDKKIRSINGWKNWETKNCDFCDIWSQFVENDTETIIDL